MMIEYGVTSTLTYPDHFVPLDTSLVTSVKHVSQAENQLTSSQCPSCFPPCYAAWPTWKSCTQEQVICLKNHLIIICLRLMCSSDLLCDLWLLLRRFVTTKQPVKHSTFIRLDIICTRLLPYLHQMTTWRDNLRMKWVTGQKTYTWTHFFEGDFIYSGVFFGECFL